MGWSPASSKRRNSSELFRYGDCLQGCKGSSFAWCCTDAASISTTRFLNEVLHRAYDLIRCTITVFVSGNSRKMAISFIRTRQGWLYLAVLLDLYSRRVVGWSMSERPDLALILNALDMALEQRRPRTGLITPPPFHSVIAPMVAGNQASEPAVFRLSGSIF